MKYEAIRSNSTRFDVKKMCDVLGVKRGSYYRWLKSQKNREQRAQDEKKEIEMIEEVFESSDRIWGYRNITKELKSQGVEISEYRVRRLMRERVFCGRKEQSMGGGYYIYKDQCGMGISCSGNGSV